MRQCPKCGERYADDMSYCPNDGSATTSVPVSARPPDDLVGTVMDGRYRIEARIGEGGMGIVYRASHVVLKKALAIKVMRSDQANDGEIVQRFVQEAQSSSAIGHPNIIGISDFGRTVDGSVYFAMEFLEGQTLGKAMEQGPLGAERAIRIFIQIADALEAAHQRGIVHRDLKPDNIFLIKRGANEDFVKVLDFGIAKVKNAAAKITRTGMVFGTPHYMSPEQAAGQSVDHRSDIYSVGIIMYQVFAGKLPFDAESYMGVITKHMYDPPVPPSSIVPPLRGSIEDIILMALAKKPEHRFQSMLALREDLEAALRREPVRASERAAMAAGDTLGFTTNPPGGAPNGSAAPGHRARPASATLPEVNADEMLRVPTHKRPVWLLPAVLVATALGIFAFFGSSPPTLPVPAVPAAGGDGSPALPTPAPVAPSAPAVPVAPVEPAPLAKRTIHVLASPVGAQLFVDDRLVGHDDVLVARPTGTVRASVRLQGYLSKDVHLDAQSPDVIRVALELAPRAPPKTNSPPRGVVLPRAAPSAPQPPAPAKRANSLNDVVDPWQ